jgi:predicted DNA-binding transcriptional regulator AlpA
MRRTGPIFNASVPAISESEMTVSKITTTTKEPAAQVAFAKKAAAVKAGKQSQPVWLRKPMPSDAPPEQMWAGNGSPARLLDKHEILGIANASFPTVWLWMRQGKFPRSRIVGGRSMWLSTEVEAWLAALPVRPIKGDGDKSVVA